MEPRSLAENPAFRGMLSVPKPLATVRGMALPRKPSSTKLRNKFRGCLLGGAVGDALGAPVEFLHVEEIEQVYGEQGIRDYAPAYGKIGAITDDTQMTLFTAEAMLSAEVASTQLRSGLDFFRAASDSYQRWLATQEHAGRQGGPRQMTSWLFQQRRLFSRRAPGTTCLSSLEALHGKSGRASNDSKGCGAVMRSAPVGMYFAHELRSGKTHAATITKTFDTARDMASITHGHPTGSLAAGFFAVVVAMLVAEEALAISLYCALCSADFSDGIVLAVNHSGDSDSTGSMTGNLLGAIHGVESIPEKWLRPLELHDVIEAMADDLAAYPDWRLSGPQDVTERDFYTKRYPI